MELRRASAAVAPEETGTRSRTPRGMSGMGGLLRVDRYPGERRVRDAAAKHGGDLGLEEFERVAVLSVRQAARVGLHMEHRVPELLVIAVDFVDDLLRAADQGGAALDEVLQ